MALATATPVVVGPTAGSPQSVGSGGRAQPMVMASSSSPQPIDHKLQISGAGDAIIGGSYSAVVATVASGATIRSVTWQITNAVESQAFDNMSGETNPFVGLTDPGGGGFNPPVSSDDVGFWWGASPGLQTITATVTFVDGFVSPPQTYQVYVTQPTGSSLAVDSPAYSWVQQNIDPNNKQNYPGFEAGGKDGVGFTVTGQTYLPAGSGDGAEIGIIQKVNRVQSLQNDITGPHTVNYGGFLLDNRPPDEPDAPGYMLVESAEFPAGSPPQFVTFNDAPSAFIIQGQMPGTQGFKNYDFCARITVNFQFQDFLEFKPGGGIWVQLQSTPTFSFSGDYKFDEATQTWGPTGNPPPDGPPNPSPSRDTTIDGSDDLGFTNWTDFAGDGYRDWSPTYPYPF